MNGNTGTPLSPNEATEHFDALCGRLKAIRRRLTDHHQRLARFQRAGTVLNAASCLIHQEIIDDLEFSEIRVQERIATAMAELQRRHDDQLKTAADAATTRSTT